MATSVLQVRLENELKNEAAALFEKLGIDTPTAVRMFLKRAVSERGIPFELRESNPHYGAGRGRSALRALQADAAANGTAGMSEREIEDEIAAYRAGK